MSSMIKVLLGWAGSAFILIAAMILGADLNEYTHSGTFVLTSVGDLWARFHAESVEVATGFLQGLLGEGLATGVSAILLEGAAFYVAAGFGLACLLVSWLPKPHRDDKMSALHREVHIA